jgi:hypothetical protein
MLPRCYEARILAALYAGKAPQRWPRGVLLESAQVRHAVGLHRRTTSRFRHARPIKSMMPCRADHAASAFRQANLSIDIVRWKLVRQLYPNGVPRESELEDVLRIADQRRRECGEQKLPATFVPIATTMNGLNGLLPREVGRQIPQNAASLL